MDGIDDCVTSWKGNSQVKTKHDREVNIVMGQIPDYDVTNPLLGKQGDQIVNILVNTENIQVEVIFVR